MLARVVLTLTAIDELADASDWYEDHTAGVGKRFVHTIRETLTLVSLEPEMFSKRKEILEKL